MDRRRPKSRKRYVRTCLMVLNIVGLQMGDACSKGNPQENDLSSRIPSKRGTQYPFLASRKRAPSKQDTRMGLNRSWEVLNGNQNLSGLQQPYKGSRGTTARNAQAQVPPNAQAQVPPAAGLQQAPSPRSCGTDMSHGQHSCSQLAREFGEPPVTPEH